MANIYSRLKHTSVFLKESKNEDVYEKLRPISDKPVPEHIPQGNGFNFIEKRWEILGVSDNNKNAVLDPLNTASIELNDEYPFIIENYVGTIKVPVGIAGPLRINGSYAHGDFYIPLATLEPTMVASYSRGAQCISEAGGCTALLLEEGVTRSPGFKFKNIIEATQFLSWVIQHYDELKKEAETTTRFGKLIEMKTHMCGNQVFLIFEYSTRDAIGQNMVTIATQVILDLIKAKCPIIPEFFTIDANMSSDKKPSFQAFQTVRGRKVTVEATIPAKIISQFLNSTPELMVEHSNMGKHGAISMGTIGVNGHFANALAAIYIACGQDAACVAESCVGTTYLELNKEGDLYASAILPNIMVGTVGKGVNLPSQKSCMDILGVEGKGKANAFSEICASVCLAGELSMIAALSVNEFTSAHVRLARKHAEAKDKLESKSKPKTKKKTKSK